MAFLYPNMELDKILKSYYSFKESALYSRFFKHQHLLEILNRNTVCFTSEVAGYSLEGREIRLLKVGDGTIPILLWSQMHGDETSGTMALMDLLNIFRLNNDCAAVAEILEKCTLYILPMVNPDGAERFTRRNAQQIDINRDYLLTVSPEAQILKAVQERIKPLFGFNLHDQSDLWGVENQANPAALSFLAPAFDRSSNLNATRHRAMQVVAGINDQLSCCLQEKIGLFDDTFEPRAFGDNFQKSGTSTILIEGGSIKGDHDHQEVRKMVFAAILTGLHAIASASYLENTVEDYFRIPKNSKSLFHVLIRNVALSGIRTSIGINYKSTPTKSGAAITCLYTVEDVGDLSTMYAHQEYDAASMQINGEVLFNCPANFALLEGSKTILSFKQGILQSK